MNYIISFPISGKNNINNLLKYYCNEYNILFSSCDYYNCCNSIICKKKSLFLNNHDFDLSVPINNNNKYLVIYCKDIIIQLENYYRYNILFNNNNKYNLKEFIIFFKNNYEYYNNFVNKWVNNNSNNNNILIIDIFDLKYNYLDISKKIFNFFFNNIQLDNIQLDNLIKNNFIENECSLYINKDYYNQIKKFLNINNNIFYYNYYSKQIYFTKVIPLYTAIIIEPREHKALELVLKNFITNLDKNWVFYIYHGNNNINYIKNIINNTSLLNYKNRIKLFNLNVDNLTFNDYNKLMYNTNFYEKIYTEMFLIYQSDSIISQKYSKLIYNFIEYDYVGAPWLNGNVGNGGLSFRRTSKMKEILKNYTYYIIKDNNEELINEDIFYSNSEKIFFNIDNKDNNEFNLKNLYKNKNINKPTLCESKFFSIEAIYNNISFGLHKCWDYLKESEIDSLNNIFPELKLLIEYNKI